MNTPELRYRIAAVSELSNRQKSRMLALMQEFYQAQRAHVFLDDLSRKQHVILLCAGETIQGFSTLSVNPAGTGTETYSVCFSGDTILHPQYWGTRELAHAFFHFIASIQQAEPHKKLYWFLISKGHRTYLYLPLFFKKYYPGLAGREDAGLAPLLDALSARMFGNCWDAKTGIIRLPGDSPMVAALQAATFRKRGHNEHVDFFLERNPGFDRGAELACLVDLSPENFLPLAERCYRMAVQKAKLL